MITTEPSCNKEGRGAERMRNITTEPSCNKEGRGGEKQDMQVGRFHVAWFRV